MSPTVYSFLHVTSGILLVAYTFKACAAPKPELRRGSLMITGILSLVMLVAGFGLQAKLAVGFPGWLIVKLVCWLGLSALAGMAFRQPQKAGMLGTVTMVLVAVAVYCVYFRPF